MYCFGLIGFPLGHSFSKTFFTKKFETEKLPYQYLNFPLSHIEQLPDIIKENPTLVGLNVTIPYKEAVIPYLDALQPEVQEIKACNCILVTRDKKLIGYNTDIVGFKISLQRHLQIHHNKALILGTGGAAKAVAYVLQQLGISYHYVSRTPHHGGYTYQQLSPDLVAAHPLIINTTPLGMHPNITDYPTIAYEGIGSMHHCFDLIYNPAQTTFLQKSALQGASTQNGLAMLELQAEEGFRIWSSYL